MTSSRESQIIVITNVYHQRPGREPISVGDGSFMSSRGIGHDKPSEVREVTLTTSWTRIPSGMELILVENQEGLFPDVIPSDQERERMAQRVVEIGLVNETAPIVGTPQPLLVIPTGETHLLTPLPGVTTFLRARTGTVSVSLMLTPRK